MPVPTPLITRARFVSPINLQWRSRTPHFLTAKHPICILRRSLQDSTKDCPQASKPKCADSPIAIPEPASPECADQRSRQVIYGDYASLEKWFVDFHDLLRFVPMSESHRVGIVSSRIDATHETCRLSARYSPDDFPAFIGRCLALVVAEEKNR